MLPRNDPDRIQITFDDHRLVANTGLILPATLALHLGLPQLALFASYSYHGCITDRDGETLALEADHRRQAEIENAIRDLKYGVGLNHLPSGRFAANGAWLAVQVLAHNLARIIYAMLRYGQAYVDADAEYYESQYRQRALRVTKRRAAQLGYQLVPIADAQAPVVSHASAAAVA